MGSNIVFTIIWLLVFGLIINKVVKNAKNQTKGNAQRSKNGSVNTGKSGYVNYTPHKDLVSVSRDMGDRRNSSVLRDDKENDWLARQLREEHRAFKATSEMFDLKIEHASHCDARLMQQFHHRNCSADGVDLANGHTIYGK